MKYFYLGKYKIGDNKTDIYCDENNLKFYALDESFEIDYLESEYLDDWMDDDCQDKGMERFEIKDSKLLHLLKQAYKSKKMVNKNIRQKSINEKVRILKTRKSQILTAKVLLVTLLATPLIINPGKKAISLYRDNQIAVALTEDKKLENYDSFCEAIACNETISSELREILFNDFNSLVFSNTPILGNKNKAIIKRIVNYDFTGLDGSNYLHALEYVLFGKSSAIYKSVTVSLDAYANGNCNNSLSVMLGELTIPMDNSFLDALFLDGEEEYVRTVADYYHVDKSRIENLIHILDCYINSNSEDEKNHFYMLYQKNVASILTSYYKEKKEYSDFDRHVLASQIFDGNYTVDNNIFSDYIKINHKTREYELYSKYYDRSTKVEVSISIYRNKLVNLINKKGNNLDYNDPDCRFLLYLYYLCYSDDLSCCNKDLVDVTSAENLADLIINDVFDENGYTTVRKEFIYSYFTSGKVNIDDLLKLIKTIDRDALSAGLYVDTVNCLKKEDYIKEGLYLGYVEKNLENLKELVTKNTTNKELYLEIIAALENETSLFDKLSLLPGFQEYKNDKIKKYELEQH